MEMGSSSMTDSGSSYSSSPPTESLNGLKFGRKIYFEDAVGPGGAPLKSPGSSSSAGCAGFGGATPPKKQRGGGGGGNSGQQVGQPPRCQVEGCQVDLSDAKAYYSRHKVCGLHSKTPTVIVAGLQQRFCQQCSRFHQLPEFDQGKRSCRRRLAGHNERRRKPQPGSILSTRFGQHSPSLGENSSRVGSFLMDFTAYPRAADRDAWATTRTSERASVNQSSNDMGKFLQHPWLSNSVTPSNLYLQGSVGGTSYPGPGIPPGECFTGVTDSSCALSLLSNQPWGSRNHVSGVGMNSLVNTQGVPVGHPMAHAGTSNHFPTNSWGFKGNEAGNSSHEMLPDLGLGRISQPHGSQYSGVLEPSQQGRRQQHMELGHTRGYDSTSQQMHWSL